MESQPESDQDRAPDPDQSELPVVQDLAGVASLLAEHEVLYVRHSKGPAADAATGHSRDYEAGVDLPGLSVSPVVPEDWWEGPVEDWVARRICKYAELGQEDDRYPWLLTGELVGWGPDHEPLVRLDEPIAIIGPSALREATQRYRSQFDVGQDSRTR